jgi:hypothetical protein
MDPQTGFAVNSTAPNSRFRQCEEPGVLVFLAGLLALVLTLHAHLALTRSINWDEFQYLRLVHEFARGELTVPLQTLHVRLFAWLPGLDIAGVDQILCGRVAMFACLLMTTGAIIMLARRFAGWSAALVAALAYLCVGYVLQHATSFRADPVGAALCMTALALLARTRPGWPMVAGFAVLMGAAFMVTIKIVLYAPAFAGIAWLRWSESGFRIQRAALLAAAPILAAVVAAALFAWHSLTLAPPEEAAGMIGRAGEAMFGLSPNLFYSALMVMLGLPSVLLMLLTARALAGGQDRGLAVTRDERIALALLLAPLVVLPIYTNTYPYFFAFILPPACAATAAVLATLPQRLAGQRAAPMIGAALAEAALVVWICDGPSRIDRQRAIQLAVNEMFPEPVAYFDFPGFLPEHRKANFFMTTWGRKNYAMAGEPHFAERQQDRPVPLLLTIEPEYNPSLLAVMEGTRNAQLFLPEDLTALRETYRQVWGPIYVAGRLVPPGGPVRWRVRVPGVYTVEGALRINGHHYRDGALVTLDRGEVALEAIGGAEAGLLWGDHLHVPTAAPPPREWWTGF